MNRTALNSTRDDADDAYKLNRLAPTELVQDIVNGKSANDTTPVKKAIRGYLFVSFAMGNLYDKRFLVPPIMSFASAAFGPVKERLKKSKKGGRPKTDAMMDEL